MGCLHCSLWAAGCQASHSSDHLPLLVLPGTQGAASGIMYVQSGLVTADLVRHPEDLWKFGSLCPTDRQPNLLMQLGQMVLARLQ